MPDSTLHASTTWKIEPVSSQDSWLKGRLSAQVRQQKASEAIYFLSVSAWGGLNHRLSLFLEHPPQHYNYPHALPYQLPEILLLVKTLRERR